MKTRKLDCQTIHFLSSHSAKMTDLIKFSPMLIRWHVFLAVNLLKDQRFKEAFHVPLTSTVEPPNSNATLSQQHMKELDTVQSLSTFGKENKLENPSWDARRSSFSILIWYSPYQRLVWFKKIKMLEFKQREGDNQGRTGKEGRQNIAGYLFNNITLMPLLRAWWCERCAPKKHQNSLSVSILWRCCEHYL